MYSAVPVWVQQTGGGGPYWVDAEDPEGDGTYVQARTSLPLTYVNWRPGEPNSPSTERCVFVTGRGLGWMNTACSGPFIVVCEH